MYVYTALCPLQMDLDLPLVGTLRFPIMGQHLTCNVYNSRREVHVHWQIHNV